MKAIIPVAGSGTRLRPLTHSKPKALLHVGSKPIIAHIMDTLVPLGCDEVILIISHEGDAIPEYIAGAYPDVTVQWVYQEERLGLGHAVNMARDKVAGDEVIIMYGDTILEGDFSGSTTVDGDGVIAVKEVEDPRRFGVVETDEDGNITTFVEKPSEPKSNLAIVGFNYIRNSGAMFDAIDEIIEKDITTKGEYQLTDAFQVMVDNGTKLKTLSIEGWFDAGTPATLLETNRYMLERDHNDRAPEGTIVIPPVYISEKAELDNCIVGPYVSIADEAVLEKTIVSDSIIGRGARVTNASLQGSLIGDNAEVVEKARVLAIGDNSTLDYGK